jgi:P-type Ca2+ transporter type 2C
MSERGFHSYNFTDVLKKLESSEKGLSNKEVFKRLKHYGLNKLPEKNKHNSFFNLLRQFKSFFVYILLLAAVISYSIGNIVDVYVISFIILLNGGIGFFREQKAEKAINALKKMVISYAKVYRDGSLVKIKSSNLVPGDVILLEEGDRIPADARLIYVKNFKSVESSLTGESFPLDKDIRALPEKTILADRKNMVFLGTFVASGSGRAVVIGTGENTELGKIAHSINKIKRTKSHFEEKTDKLALQMGLIALFGAILIFCVGFFIRDLEFGEIFLFTISALISGIPEGLPAILSIVLAFGALRMSKRKAIIRHLPATETLGVVDTILTDKTGTLTQNKMFVKKIALPMEEDIDISGIGWEPMGEFYQGKKLISPLERPGLVKLLHISTLCNNAKLIKDGEKGDYKIIGDPTEAALVVLAEKAGLKKDDLEKRDKRIDDLPFNDRLKYRASLSSLIGGKGGKEIYVVGAPEAVLEKCEFLFKKGRKAKLIKGDKEKILKRVSQFSKQSMRVISLAYREIDDNKKEIEEKDVEGLVFVGFVGMLDPPREEVKDSVSKARGAGIRVIMTTGDHKDTAVAIAKEVGIISDLDKNDLALTGEELDNLSDSEFLKAINEINVFARLTPGMKLKIASVLQNEGRIVAMTGDGVNDAPALKKSDIGISMGLSGTDVARESSEMILTDDNFSTIINAVEEGRVVFNNTRQTSYFLVTTNFAEHATLVSTLLLGLPLPLLPAQILWLNLVTDTGAGIGLASEPGHHDALEDKPRNSKEDILTKDVIPFLALMTVIMIASTLLIFYLFLGDGLDKARTGAFGVMALTQIFNSFNMRSLKKSVFKIGVFSNKIWSWASVLSILLLGIVMYVPFLQGIFQFVGLSLLEVVGIAGISSSVLIFGEGYKYFRKKD